MNTTNYGDRNVFKNSVSKIDNDLFFSEKRNVYIVDDTGQSGSWSGQIQFSLQNFSTLGDWKDIKNANVQIPVRMTIKNITGTAAVGKPEVECLSLKNGYHHLINSAQLEINGQTLHSAMNYRNIVHTTEVLTTWDKSTYEKMGATYGFSSKLDDYYDTINDKFVKSGSAIGTVADNKVTFTSPADYEEPERKDAAVHYKGISSAEKNEVWNAIIGETLTDVKGRTNSASIERSYRQAININSDNHMFAFDTLGNNVNTTGHGTVAYRHGDEANDPAANNAYVYVKFVLATIRLKDLFPVLNDMPLIRQLKGALYLNYNSAEADIEFDSDPEDIKTVDYRTPYGQMCPMLFNEHRFIGRDASSKWQLACDITSQEISGFSAKPVYKYCRLNMPVYDVSDAKYDDKLSVEKTWRYPIFKYSPIKTLGGGQSVSHILSTGISNIKKVIIVPYYSHAKDLKKSPFSLFGSCTSPFAAISDLQVTIGNKNIFMNPVNMSYEMFLDEISSWGIEGGQNDMLSSGLLDQHMWQGLYRFYIIDCHRRLSSEDGSPKSVQVSFTNATTKECEYLCFTVYEKEITCNSSTGEVVLQSAFAN